MTSINRTTFTAFLCFFCVHFVLKSQNTEKFNSKIENALFEKVDSHSNLSWDLKFNLLCAISPNIEEDTVHVYKNKLDFFLNSIAKKMESLQDKKKVKFLFKSVHKKFLVKYDIEAFFSDIFNDGRYNCVSGTALYAYCLDFFKINYKIKETPTHVYIVAFPYEYNILIETTIPGQTGIYLPSQSLVKKTVDQLVSNKLFTDKELRELGYEKIYNDYFFGEDSIKDVELIGIQYYNNTIKNIVEKNFKEAYKSLLKSKLFYKNKRLNLMTKDLVYVLFDNLDVKNLDNFDWYITVLKTDVPRDYKKFLLAKILGDFKDEISLNKIEKKLNAVKEEEWRNLSLEIYYMHRADVFQYLQNEKEVLLCSEKIYKLNPNNIEAKNFIGRSKIKEIARRSLNEQRLKEIDDLILDYSFIKDYDTYKEYKIFLLSFLMFNNYSNNNGTEGDQYRIKLEEVLDGALGKIIYDQERVGVAYAAVGAYYYRQNKSKIAIKMMKEGLKYAPGHMNLQKKIKLIEK